MDSYRGAYVQAWFLKGGFFSLFFGCVAIAIPSVSVLLLLLLLLLLPSLF